MIGTARQRELFEVVIGLKKKNCMGAFTNVAHYDNDASEFAFVSWLPMHGSTEKRALLVLRHLIRSAADSIMQRTAGI